MGEERMQHAEVGVSECSIFVGEVEEVANHDVDEDVEVVGVEVLVR